MMRPHPKVTRDREKTTQAHKQIAQMLKHAHNKDNPNNKGKEVAEPLLKDGQFMDCDFEEDFTPEKK